MFLFLGVFLCLIFVSHCTESLIWSDEFNDGSLNTSNWILDLGNGIGGWGNEELEYYAADTITVENGMLRIQPRVVDGMYTSGRIKSAFSFTFGYFVARIKTPKASSIWPAFWMLGSQIERFGWPSCGEIDIMETVDFADSLFTTVHWSSNGINGHPVRADYGTKAYIGPGILFGDDFHNYWAKWNESSLTMGFDDVQTFAIDLTPAEMVAFRDPINPFFILLNVAVGGSFPQKNPKIEEYPVDMFVDYVRVYELIPDFPEEPSGFPPTPTNIPATNIPQNGDESISPGEAAGISIFVVLFVSLSSFGIYHSFFRNARNNDVADQSKSALRLFY